MWDESQYKSSLVSKYDKLMGCVIDSSPAERHEGSIIWQYFVDIKLNCSGKDLRGGGSQATAPGIASSASALQMSRTWSSGNLRIHTSPPDAVLRCTCHTPGIFGYDGPCYGSLLPLSRAG
jgi:hypothetical protein